MDKASTILGDVKKWITVEADPLLLSHAASQQDIRGHIVYPDIIAGISDCVAHTALVTINKTLRFLWSSWLRSSSLEERGSQFLDDSETIERWRHRAIAAFRFVQKESILAAKPLDFGLRRIQSSESTSERP